MDIIRMQERAFGSPATPEEKAQEEADRATRAARRSAIANRALARENARLRALIPIIKHEEHENR